MPLVNVLYRPIEKINAVIETYPKGVAGFRRCLEILDTRPDIGDTVVFAGPSGAGKASLCSLLPRFCDVTGGRIAVRRGGRHRDRPTVTPTGATFVPWT